MIKTMTARMLLIVVAAIAVAWLQTSIAAAAPANDDFASATAVVTPLPFTDSINTSDATAAAADPSLSCAPPSGHTVWYSFTAPADMRILANTFGSDYDTTLSVYTGSSPGSLTEIACNDDFGFPVPTVQSQVIFAASEGVTYHFMVGSFDGAPGGNLTFSVEEAPPPLEVSVSIDPVGSVVSRTGLVTLHGTVTCSRPASVELFGVLDQRFGRFIIRGFLDDLVECSGETPWSATLSGDTGRFGPGRAQATVDAFFIDPVTGEFVFAETSATVRLRGSH